MAFTDRRSAFLQHVAQQSFVCSIATAMARQARLPLFEMPEAVQGRAEVARDAIRELLASGRGSAVGIIYPSEPENYEQLQALHADVHATVFTAAMLEDIAVARAENRITLPYAGTEYPSFMLPYVALQSRQLRKGPFAAYDACNIVTELGVPVKADPGRSAEGIRAAVSALLGIDPNLAPVVNRNVLQAIVLSPQFTGDSSEEIRALLREINMPDLPHGRHAPVTTMVLNYHADVMAALQSSTGKVIRERMNMALSFTRYKSMHVLAEKPDAAKRYQNLLKALTGLDGKEA